MYIKNDNSTNAYAQENCGSTSSVTQLYTYVYVINIFLNTVECCDNVVQYNVILHSSLQWLIQNINQSMEPQNTTYNSP